MKTKTKFIILIALILAFLTITIFVLNKNVFFISFDNAVRNLVNNFRSPALTDTMLSITKIGNLYETLAIFVIFGLFLFLKNKKYFYSFSIATSLSILLTIIKLPIQKIRPDSLFLQEQGFSFPSYHATIAMVFLLSSIIYLAPLFKKSFSKYAFIIVTSIVFPLVALSRIYLSVHWTSDVFAGIILGSICFIIADLICCQKKENVL